MRYILYCFLKAQDADKVKREEEETKVWQFCLLCRLTKVLSPNRFCILHPAALHFRHALQSSTSATLLPP